MLMNLAEDMMCPWVIRCPHRVRQIQVLVCKKKIPFPSNLELNLGIRNQIFSPIYQNNDGYYALDESFVTANVMIKCDASWTSDVYDNFNQYVRGAS